MANRKSGRVNDAPRFVYLGTGAKDREENQRMMQCIKNGIDQLGEECEIIILGDMNAHIEDIDEYTDPRSRILMICVKGMIYSFLTAPRNAKGR